MTGQEERRAKYDRGASDYVERFADPDAIVSSYLRLLGSWGTPVHPGAAVLELGCADGFVTAALARAGYRVTAIDLSPRMIEVARERLEHERLEADLLVGDIQEMDLPVSQSAVLGLMRSFFSYVEDPLGVLRRLVASAPKILVDADPRQVALRDCETTIRSAGYEHVSRRAMFVPTRYRMAPPVRGLFRTAELTPGVRGLILRRKFLVALKGERA